MTSPARSSPGGGGGGLADDVPTYGTMMPATPPPAAPASQQFTRPPLPPQPRTPPQRTKRYPPQGLLHKRGFDPVGPVRVESDVVLDDLAEGVQCYSPSANMMSHTANTSDKQKMSFRVKTVRRYVCGPLIGQGGFGKVRLAISAHPTRPHEFQPSAIKIVSTRMLKRARGGMAVLRREAAIQQSLQSRYIMRLLDYFEDHVKQKEYLVFPYMIGSLQNVVDNCLAARPLLTIPTELVVKWAHDLFAGLAHMHTEQVCHKDIKPSNCMIAPDLNLTISDFGTAERVGPTGVTRGSESTPAYASPEVAKGEGPFSGFAADMWAAGVTLYVILSLRLPFNGDSLWKTYEAIINNTVDLGPAARSCAHVTDLLTGLLCKDAAVRVCADTAVAHPVFDAYAWRDLAPLATMAAKITPHTGSQNTSFEGPMPNPSFSCSLQDVLTQTPESAARVPSSGAVTSSSPPLPAALRLKSDDRLSGAASAAPVRHTKSAPAGTLRTTSPDGAARNGGTSAQLDDMMLSEGTYDDEERLVAYNTISEGDFGPDYATPTTATQHTFPTKAGPALVTAHHAPKADDANATHLTMSTSNPSFDSFGCNTLLEEPVAATSQHLTVPTASHTRVRGGVHGVTSSASLDQLESEASGRSQAVTALTPPRHADPASQCLSVPPNTSSSRTAVSGEASADREWVSGLRTVSSVSASNADAASPPASGQPSSHDSAAHKAPGVRRALRGAPPAAADSTATPGMRPNKKSAVSMSSMDYSQSSASHSNACSPSVGCIVWSGPQGCAISPHADASLSPPPPSDAGGATLPAAAPPQGPQLTTANFKGKLWQREEGFTMASLKGKLWARQSEEPEARLVVPSPDETPVQCPSAMTLKGKLWQEEEEAARAQEAVLSAPTSPRQPVDAPALPAPMPEPAAVAAKRSTSAESTVSLCSGPRDSYTPRDPPATDAQEEAPSAEVPALTGMTVDWRSGRAATALRHPNPTLSCSNLSDRNQTLPDPAEVDVTEAIASYEPLDVRVRDSIDLHECFGRALNIAVSSGVIPRDPFVGAYITQHTARMARSFDQASTPLVSPTISQAKFSFASHSFAGRQASGAEQSEQALISPTTVPLSPKADDLSDHSELIIPPADSAVADNGCCACIVM